MELDIIDFAFQAVEMTLPYLRVVLVNFGYLSGSQSNYLEFTENLIPLLAECC